MLALPVIVIRDKPGTNPPVAAAQSRLTAAVTACLYFLLFFTTATVFVKAAWALQAFQIGVFLLLGFYLVASLRAGKIRLAHGWAPWLVYLIPLWGLLQIVAHTTASSMETREAVLRWGSLAGVFYLSQVCGQSRTARRTMLTAFLVFASAMAVLCLTQLFTSRGMVLWFIPSGYPHIYATFQYYNNYAQFVELALPIALWRALSEGWRSWWYALAGGVLYASAFGSASRAGVVLCTVELVAMIVIAMIQLRDPVTGRPPRATLAILAMIPILAAVFTLVVGWEHMWARFHENDPYLMRKDYLVAAVDMARQRPITGYGLGTFPEVYQRYAVKDFPYYANHAHNDWAEFAADGGIPFMLLVFLPFAVMAREATRHPWAIGLIAVVLHAFVDYPFPRPAVSGWMFLMLAVLYLSRLPEPGTPQPDSAALQAPAEAPAQEPV